MDERFTGRVFVLRTGEQPGKLFERAFRIEPRGIIRKGSDVRAAKRKRKTPISIAANEPLHPHRNKGR